MKLFNPILWILALAGTAFLLKQWTGSANPRRWVNLDYFCRWSLYACKFRNDCLIFILEGFYNFKLRFRLSLLFFCSAS